MSGRWMPQQKRQRHKKLRSPQTETIKSPHSDPRCSCIRCLATRDAVKRHKADLPMGHYIQNTRDPHRVMRVDPNGQRFELLKDGGEREILRVMRSTSPATSGPWTISTSSPVVNNLTIVETWCTAGAPGDVPFPGFRFAFDVDLGEGCCTGEVCSQFGEGDAGCNVVNDCEDCPDGAATQYTCDLSAATNPVDTGEFEVCDACDGIGIITVTHDSECVWRTTISLCEKTVNVQLNVSSSTRVLTLTDAADDSVLAQYTNPATTGAPSCFSTETLSINVSSQFCTWPATVEVAPV